MGFFEDIYPNFKRYEDSIPTPNFRRNALIPTQIETPALNRYRDYLDTMPARQDYAPSNWRRLASALGGVSAGWRQGPTAGIEASTAINELPFRNAVTDWSMKGKGLQEAANIEQDSMKNEVNSWRNFANSQLSQERNDITRDRNQTLGRQQDENLEIRRQTLEANKKKIDAQIQSLNNPDYDVVSDRAGKDYLLDKKTGNRVPIDVDLYGKPEEIEAATKRAIQIMQGYTSSNQRVAEINAEQRGLDRESRESLAGNKTVSPSVAGETKKDSDALKEVAAKNPDWVGKWIAQRDTTGTLSIKFPTNDSPPEEQEDFNRFYQEYNRYRSKKTTSTVPNKSSSTTPSKKTITLSSGRTVTVE